MYDNNNLKCMINCLEEYGYAYTKCEHSNGYCTVNSDLLLKQLKLNEQEIRNKAIDEFITAYKEYCEEHYGCVAEQEIDDMKRVAEQIKGGAE